MNGDVGHSDPEPPSLPRKVSLERGSEGYGFNLHGEKGIHGQFISAIDDGSPAQLNDIKVGDRVIAVNDEDVDDLPHAKVVDRIRAGGNHVTLLLVDGECDEFYKNLGQRIPQDKYVTVRPSNAVPAVIPDIVEEQVRNGEEDMKVDEVTGPEVQDTSTAEDPHLVETKSSEELEENSEDGNEYEEVIPVARELAKPIDVVDNSAETTPVPEEVPSTVWQQTEPSPAPEQTPIAIDTSTTVPESTTTTTTISPSVDMAAARPKPKRNEVKRATQNWKQKYDDFNKL